MTFLERSRAFSRAFPFLLSVAATAGCTGGVVVVSDASGDTTGPTGEPCSTSSSSPTEAAPLAVTAVKSAAFVGGTLHVEADVDGVARYLVIAIDGDGIARAVAMPDELLGPANLAQSRPGVHARLRRGEDGAPVIDVVDTSNPEAPALLASAKAEGSLEGAPVFSAADDRLYFCTTAPGAGNPSLWSLDLTSPEAPAPPVAIDSFACYWQSNSTYSTNGPTWLRWDSPTGYEVQSVYVYAMSPGAASTIVDYGYNQTGVHMYGNAITAAASRERAVVDPENASLFLLANPTGDPYSPENPPFTWASLHVGSERRLLGVADRVAYLVTDLGVRAYDVTDIVSPALLPFEATIGPSEGNLTTLAANERYLAIVDEEGTLFLLPRDAPGDVAPLVVHTAEYVPPDTSGCSE